MKSYAFKVGSIDCTVLLDGARKIGAAGIMKRFPNGTEAEYRQAYDDIGLSLDKADDSFNMLVAKIGSETVLIDTGEGGKPYGGFLLNSMAQAGMNAADITQVVITHSHTDHIMGLLTDDGQPVFPNATYVLAKDELDFWQQIIETNAPNQRPIVAMMQDQGLRLIDLDEPILPGMTAVPLPGHTPGHIGLLIESEGEQVLHLADQLHSPMQFAHPEWSVSFDIDTRVSVPVRRSALQRAADDNLLTLFYHLTFPGLGWVKPAETGFTWEPLLP